MKNQRGFGLVETLASMALLMAVILGGLTLMDAQRNSRKSRSGQTMYRYLAIQTASVVTGSSERFPPLAFSTAWNDSTDLVMYVGCFSPEGELIENDSGTRDFIFHQQARSRLDREEPSGRCPTSSGAGRLGFEVRFWYAEPATREVTIEILDFFLLNTRVRRFNPKHRFTIFR